MIGLLNSKFTINTIGRSRWIALRWAGGSVSLFKACHMTKSARKAGTWAKTIVNTPVLLFASESNPLANVVWKWVRLTNKLPNPPSLATNSGLLRHPGQPEGRSPTASRP